MSDWRQRVLYDDDGVHLDYTLRWRFVNTHVIEFKIWGMAVELPSTPLYQDEATNEFVKDPDTAVPFMEGDLKWDGCSNLRFPGQEHAMLHFCYSNSGDLARLMDEVYALGPEIEAWDFREVEQ